VNIRAYHKKRKKQCAQQQEGNSRESGFTLYTTEGKLKGARAWQRDAGIGGAFNRRRRNQGVFSKKAAGEAGMENNPRRNYWREATWGKKTGKSNEPLSQYKEKSSSKLFGKKQF